MDDINLLKLVLVEKRKTGKWLAEHPSTVSKWCSNVTQPNLLDVDIQYLINKTR